LTETQIWSITNQICQALQVLHAHHILHRDIKPGNIILREDGSVKLIDFGAARLATAQEKGHDTLIMGTPGFAPPEQFGFAPTDVRSDLYALGMTMKALWAPAYHGPLRAIANRCTKFDPDQRINSATELERC
jgi:serine/threonine protein kinase